MTIDEIDELWVLVFRLRCQHGIASVMGQRCTAIMDALERLGAMQRYRKAAA